MLRVYMLVGSLLLISCPCLAAPAQLQVRPGLRAVATPSAEERAPDAAMLQRLRQPLPRMVAVDALLANTDVARQLRARIPSIPDISMLRTRTITGTAVAHAATVDFRSRGAAEVPSYDGLDWASGIFISPTEGAPVYRGETRNYATAVMSLSGVHTFPSYGFKEIVRDGVSRHAGDGHIGISVNLPQHSGIYLVSFRMACSDPRVFTPENMNLFVTRTVPTNFEHLAFTASADEEAVFALLDIPPGTDPIDPTPEPPMEQVTVRIKLTWDSFLRSVYFGGVTITKL